MSQGRTCLHVLTVVYVIGKYESKKNLPMVRQTIRRTEDYNMFL